MRELDREALTALGETIHVLGDVFKDGEGSAEALLMAVATLRSAADLLEVAAVGWDTQEGGEPA